MRLIGKLLNTVVKLKQNDKASKLEQLFKIIPDVFPQYSNKTLHDFDNKSGFKYCDILKTTEGCLAVKTAIRLKDYQF